MKKTKVTQKSIAETVSDTAESVGAIAKEIRSAMTGIGSSAMNAGDTVVQKIKSIELNTIPFNTEDVLRQAMKIPLVKIKRAKFLAKELKKYYPEDVINKAIERNPAYAGIEREKINKIAKHVINYETNKVSAISFAAGIPGGPAMAATIPADITQYFGFILRVMQKLAYLYGFDEFEFSEDEVSDETMNQVMVFLGVMLGVRGVNAGIRAIAEAASKKVSKSLAQQALTKTTFYPIVKKVAQAVGIKMTKQIFAGGVSKLVPVVGGIVSGGVTYFSFKPCAYKLLKSFKDLNLSDPEFYKRKSEIST